MIQASQQSNLSAIPDSQVSGKRKSKRIASQAIPNYDAEKRIGEESKQPRKREAKMTAKQRRKESIKETLYEWMIQPKTPADLRTRASPQRSVNYRE